MSLDNIEDSVTPEDQELVKGSPEYMTAMAEKYRATKGAVAAAEGQTEESAPGADKPVKPENVPDKFWDAENGVVRQDELLKSLAHLESELTKSKQAPKKEGDADGAAADAAETAGLDWNELRSTVISDGELTDDQYKALEDEGYPKELVDDYIDNLKYRVQAETEKCEGYAGGKPALDDLMVWASQNLNESEKKLMNDTLATPNWRMAVDTLQARRAKGASGVTKEPALVDGGNGTPSPTGYKNRDEMKVDMSDPRYGRDQSFRDAVRAKMANAVWNQR